MYFIRKEIINEKESINNFWSIVLNNSTLKNELIQKSDEDSLKYITDITCNFINGIELNGFEIEFHFKENPYFNNNSIKKVYEMKDGLYFPSGTEINWKNDKNLTQKIIVKTKKHKSGKKTKKVKSKVDCDSFYNFFKEIAFDQEGEDSEEEELQDHLVDIDIDIGMTLKDSIIPNAIDYYTGKEIDRVQETLKKLMLEDEEGMESFDEDEEDEVDE